MTSEHIEHAPAEYLTKANLRARGWTLAMIDTLLGAPDKEVRNSNRKTCFASVRVFAAEQTPEFVLRKSQASPRSRAQNAAAAGRRDAALAAASEVEFSLPIMKVSELTGRAIASFNRTLENPARRASLASEPTFLAYICVHWLRRQNVEYGRAVAATKGQPGRWEAYYRLRGRLLDGISAAYPHLAAECTFQRNDELPPDSRTGFAVEDFEALEPSPDDYAWRFRRPRSAASQRG